MFFVDCVFGIKIYLKKLKTLIKKILKINKKKKNKQNI